MYKALDVPNAAYLFPSRSFQVCCALAGPEIVFCPMAVKPPIYSVLQFLNLVKSPSIHCPSAPDGVSDLLNPALICTFVKGICTFYIIL